MAADAKPSTCGEDGPTRPGEPHHRSVKLNAAAYRMLAALERASSPHGALRALTHRARAEIVADPSLAGRPLVEVLSTLAQDGGWPVPDPAPDEPADDSADGVRGPTRTRSKGPELILERRSPETR